MDVKKLSSYFYDLPKDLIADRPIEGRHHSKLLVYKVSTDEIIHDHYLNIDKYLDKNSLLVFNQSKVFPCRLRGKKKSGGKCEIFILVPKLINDEVSVMIKSRGQKKIGDQFYFDDDLMATLKSKGDGLFKVSFNKNQAQLDAHLKKFGKIPIPPYIRGGESDSRDIEDYQTLYAKNTGSVAAPTAGLHFTDEIFERLKKKGIDKAFATLHVGMGTFLPVKTENIIDHKMHSEKYFVDKKNIEKLQASKKIIAVGTTALRVLESSYNVKKQSFDLNENKEYSTDIFLHPGKTVESIDGLITNFHLPGSTLLMLVSTLIGIDKALEIYRIAISKKYRFFSYGDGMLILR